MDTVQHSKFLSFILRHEPESIGLKLDPQGWASIDELIEKANAAGTRFSRADLLHAVETNTKKRFSVSSTGHLIRAAQGHSFPVELGLPPQEPPALLYHGTATQFRASIISAGLKRQSRRHVHLSVDEDTARSVGTRYGKPAIIKIDARRMYAVGYKFYRADNGVWLTDYVPPEFFIL